MSERVSPSGDYWSETNDRYPDHVELLSAGEGAGSDALSHSVTGRGVRWDIVFDST